MKITKPEMIIFDYGDTLLREPDMTFQQESETALHSNIWA